MRFQTHKEKINYIQINYSVQKKQKAKSDIDGMGNIRNANIRKIRSYFDKDKSWDKCIYIYIYIYLYIYI